MTSYGRPDLFWLFMCFAEFCCQSGGPGGSRDVPALSLFHSWCPVCHGGRVSGGNSTNLILSVSRNEDNPSCPHWTRPVCSMGWGGSARNVKLANWSQLLLPQTSFLRGKWPLVCTSPSKQGPKSVACILYEHNVMSCICCNIFLSQIKKGLGINQRRKWRKMRS